VKVVTISSKGQITLPAVFLRNLNLKPKTKVILEQSSESLIIKPVKGSIIEQLAGSLSQFVPKEKLGKSWKEVKHETMKMVAAEIAKEGVEEA